MQRYRLIVADDHAETRAGLCRLLEDEFDVVAAVADGRALVERAEELSPDVVVTDISMPRMDGISAAATILHNHPNTPIVLVSVHTDIGTVERVMAMGVRGYVSKLEAGDELVDAVHAALRGECHVGHSLRAGLGDRN
jgi:DNA-binding NarL/FixJ family response regulator